MGGSASLELEKQRQNSRQIDKLIRLDKKVAKKTQKLLLLGAGEAGKSTIFKQLILLHKSGFTVVEVELKKELIYSNMIRSMFAMLKAMDKLNIYLSDSSLQKDAALVLKTVDLEMDRGMSEEMSWAMARLWADNGVQTAYSRRNTYQLVDCAQYFLDNVDRIGREGYTPTDQDILHCRIATTGVVEINFAVKNWIFRVVDVGGQRSERKKWIHQFDNVDAVVFVAAVSEYDQKLQENNTDNRLTEALVLWRQVCNLSDFANSSMILFLNKTDLFEEKIKHVPLADFMSQYKGDDSYESCMKFVQSLFEECDERPKRAARPLFIHETCATNTDQIKIITQSVFNACIEQNCKNAGIM